MTVNVPLLDPEMETDGAVTPEREPYVDVELGAYAVTEADQLHDWFEMEYSLFGFPMVSDPDSVAVPGTPSQIGFGLTDPPPTLTE